MTYLSHWIPTFAGAAVLALAGFILRAIIRREEIAAARHRPRPESPED